jgi:hypothetical protein
MSLSPAGYSSEEGPESRLTLRPTVAKTFLKGVIAIAAFSLFLQLSWANLVHYLIFLSLCLSFLLVFILLKRGSSFELGEEYIVIRRNFRTAASFRYQDILDISVSQGMLARRFKCGTVFLLLRTGRGSVKVLGGGTAEQLDDIPDPNHVSDWIASKLSPFTGSIEP